MKLVLAAILFASALLSEEPRRLALVQREYRLAAGETAPIRLTAEGTEVIRKTTKLAATMTPEGQPGIQIGVEPESGSLFLAAPLTISPGVYDVTVRLSDAGGLESVGTMRVTVDPLPLLAVANRPPVILLNGWQIGLSDSCPVSSSSVSTFGYLASYLYADGLPMGNVKFFDNCLECKNCAIEDLGNKLGQVISSLRRSDGSLAPEVDVISHSMGGLIVRSYLSGKQLAPGVFNPPRVTKVRKAVFVGTPHFGVNPPVVAGDQANQMLMGSQFLLELATWNQQFDDIRDVDSIAVIGNGGISSKDDGLVQLTSASLYFAGGVAERTRIVPYCHSDSIWVRPSCRYEVLNLAQVIDASHLTARIIRSFLESGTEWKSIGHSPAQDPWLSHRGGVYFSMSDGADLAACGKSPRGGPFASSP